MTDGSYILDDSTRLQPLGKDRFQCETDKRFWNYDSAFGGWVAALLIEAIRQNDDFRGSVVSQNIQYHRAIRESAIEVHVQLLERRRTLDFWSLQCVSTDDDAILISATIVSGEKTPSSLEFVQSPGDAPPQQSGVLLEQRDMTPSWFSHFEMYLVKGIPFRQNPKPETTVWIREHDGRPVDDKSVAAIVDTPMPRTFFVSDKRVPAATVSLSTFFMASEEELASVGNQFVRLDTSSAGIRHSSVNQQSWLYDESGLLLATSYQMARFRSVGGG